MKPTLAMLKRQMEAALASFHRIPGECDLDRVETGRRLRRMTETRLRYQAALQKGPSEMSDPRYYVQSEQITREPRLYWIEDRTIALRYRRTNSLGGGHNRRTVEKICAKLNEVKGKDSK
jgi:hypothetical protein